MMKVLSFQRKTACCSWNAQPNLDRILTDFLWFCLKASLKK